MDYRYIRGGIRCRDWSSTFLDSGVRLAWFWPAQYRRPLDPDDFPVSQRTASGLSLFLLDFAFTLVRHDFESVNNLDCEEKEKLGFAMFCFVEKISPDA